MPATRKPTVEERADLDPEVEHWLRTEVVAAYDAFDRAPQSALSIEEVRAHLAEERKRLSAKTR